MIVYEPREDGINDPNLGPLISDRLVSLLGDKYRCAKPMTHAAYRGLADWVGAHEAQMPDEERRQGSKYLSRAELNDYPRKWPPARHNLI